jgi:hypothetical protein
MKKRSAYAGAVPAPLVAVDYNPLRLAGASMHVQLAGTLAEIARVYALVFDYSMGQDAHLLADLHVTGDIALARGRWAIGDGRWTAGQGRCARGE